MSATETTIQSPFEEDWKIMGFVPIEWGLVAQPEFWLRIKITSIEIPPAENPVVSVADRRKVIGLTVSSI